jgi:hypothetical protein
MIKLLRVDDFVCIYIYIYMGVKLGFSIKEKKIIHGDRKKKFRTSEEAKQERQLHDEELKILYLLQILPHELKERASAGGLMSW